MTVLYYLFEQGIIFLAILNSDFTFFSYMYLPTLKSTTHATFFNELSLIVLLIKPISRTNYKNYFTLSL